MSLIVYLQALVNSFCYGCEQVLAAFLWALPVSEAFAGEWTKASSSCGLLPLGSDLQMRFIVGACVH